MSSLSGLVGLSLSYALSITALLSGLIFNFAQTEMQLVSVERTEEYSTGLPPEPQHQNAQVRPTDITCAIMKVKENCILKLTPELLPRVSVCLFHISCPRRGLNRAAWSSALWFWPTGTAFLTLWMG